MAERVLVIAAHPDDEILGCGGTIAAHARRGDEVHVAILAEGVTGRDAQRDRDGKLHQISELARQAEEANRSLGAKSVEVMDLPDNRMDSVDLLEVVKKIEIIVGRHKPGIVYTHHAGDVNVDHVLTHKAVVTACRPQPGSSVKTLLFFEVLSSTDYQTAESAPAFTPNYFVDIGKTLDAKLKALEIYKGEMRPWPHARSLKTVEHLARLRGSSVGLEAAEAFILGRGIVS
jgi:LmbE family N-acetylglucosaminyl deacetylase